MAKRYYFASKDVESFMQAALLAEGVDAAVVQAVSSSLLQASLRGTDSHGVRLLPHYLASVRGGRLNPKPAMRFERRAASCGILEADDTFGAAAGYRAMDEAINMAKEAGSGFVAVKNSSHCGAMAHYALRAARRDMVGLAFTHATSTMLSANGVRPFMGTNPICVTAPLYEEEPFCFDSAPTPFSNNKVKQYRDDGRALPSGVAADEAGKETLDSDLAKQLLPIGGYKGFGLSIVVDMLCGMFSGMAMGDEITRMYGNSLSEKRKLGQFYGAFDIKAFEDVSVFKKRLQDFVNRLRREPRADPERSVMAPGDPEKHTRQQRLESGIPLSATDKNAFDEIARRNGVQPLEEKVDAS